MKKRKILAFEQNYNLLSDEPLTTAERQNIEFGHEEIAKVVADLVLEATPPFTIGLFGKWGTGKTTIIHFVKDHLGKQGVKTVIFDVWKYEEDSLRRQFLITLDEKLKLGRDYKRILNQSLSKPFEMKFFENFKLNFKNFVFRGGIVFILMFLLAAVGKYTNLSDWLVQNGWLNPKIVEALYDFSLLALVLTFLLNSVTTVYGIIQEQRTDSAEGFEDRFYNEILSDPKIRGRKLLIVIDNLDRTAYDKATDLLSDIKTFLSKEKDDNKVIFLIACDEEAIKKHLERSNFDDPAEFLRKFFNTSVKIPRFLGEELDQYTRNLLSKTGIEEFENSYELEWLITYTFRDNPREIKQFINTLISHYLLAKQMEETKQIITKGVITKKIDALAKLLIIRQKFPNAYNEIQKMALSRLLTWHEIQETPGEIFSKIFNRNENERKIIEKEKQEFVEFVKNTPQINVTDLSIFVRLRQSEQEQNLPGLEEYIVAAESRKIDEAKNIFNKFPRNKIKDFDDVLKRYIQKAKESNKLPHIWILGSVTIKATGDSLKFLKSFVRALILNFPKGLELVKYIEDYPPKEIFAVIFPLLADQRYKNKIIESYLTLFTLSLEQTRLPHQEWQLPEKYILELLNIIVQHKANFRRPEYKKVVKNGLKDRFFTEQFLSIFVNNNLEKEFITEEVKEKYINSIGKEDLNDIELLSKKLKFLPKMTLNKVSYQTIQKIKELVQVEKQQAMRQLQRLSIVNFLVEFLTQESIKDALKTPQHQLIITIISSIIINWYHQDSDPKNRLLFIRLTKQFLEIVKDNNQKVQFKSCIQDFIHNTVNIEIVNEFSNSELKYFVNFAPQEFRTAIGRNPPIFDKVHNHLSGELTDQIIIDFINTKTPLVVSNTLKGIDYKVKNPVQIISSMLDKLQSVDPAGQEQYFELIAKMECGNNAELIERFYKVLLSLKDQKPETVKKYSQSKFFNEAQQNALQENL